MQFSTLFCDLDETLYPSSSGLWEQIRGRINGYMHERLGFPWEQIPALRERYFREYGTTLRGLQANHDVDMEDYLAYVHAVPLDQFLQPDAALRSALVGIPMRKYIFTNADRNHAGRVVAALGLQGIFDGVIDVHVIAPYCKPMTEAFKLALKAAGDPEVRSCVLIDDQARITQVARQLGFFTILISKDGSSKEADATLERLAGLPDLLKGF